MKFLGFCPSDTMNVYKSSYFDSDAIEKKAKHINAEIKVFVFLVKATAEVWCECVIIFPLCSMFLILLT